ncbi:hypothetical protein [Lentilactobacillus kisonensis]|uniref:Uncharacterized protein n=2 Tax=Lentilactobacillus kisonensis TaxID=481722 RepID=H1LGW9_9LACO|nr:hypothetical protein [Lentilactobacillus kisonensis]EHO50749.1 hypothetical protein HMPREF9104_01850 [Lentilactobacillus kisonensis F0435]KRL21952.1 hypothetical protein FC98_GL000515 [Lentilactobacillus kisonensis DSM 19906 = JCM 15041]
MLLIVTLIFLAIFHLTYKFLTKWVWTLLLFAIIYDFGLWMVEHWQLSIVILCILLGLYDHFVYAKRHHSKTLFGINK